MTTRINNAGEIALKDEGVDFNHLKKFSAVRPERQHLFNPPEFTGLDILETADDFSYPIGISMHRQDPANWSTMAGTAKGLVWTFANSASDGAFQINVNYTTGTIWMRMFDVDSGAWTSWQEISAIEAIRTLAQQVDADLDAHKLADTDTHGIAAVDGTIESTGGAQAKVDAHAGVNAGAAQRGHVLRGAHISNIPDANQAAAGGDTVDITDVASKTTVDGLVFWVNTILAELRAADVIEDLT